MTLAQILREMNVYSNNAMAEMLAQSVGGAKATAKLAAEAAGVPSAEILLVNGSGLGVENRVSPRAAAAMLMTVERILQPHQIGITDLFPVSGRDERGTMLARDIPEGAAVKTGTLRDVSALAGVLPTRDRDRVWFAIINRGGDIEGFRAQQDQLLARLTETWGSPPAANTSVTQPPERLGDPQRNVPVNQTASRF
jgi:D-alanyl-D-alanine carboxypeptidase/D-alanyl-D-alanine-endopeptidase (penicillin-binding protein 4)